MIIANYSADICERISDLVRRRYRRTRHHAVIVYEFIVYVGAESRENRQHYDLG